jgi:hypothetical protein
MSKAQGPVALFVKPRCRISPLQKHTFHFEDAFKRSCMIILNNLRLCAFVQLNTRLLGTPKLMAREWNRLMKSTPKP